MDNSRLFHNVGIVWYVVCTENCVLASVCGRLLFWRVIMSCWVGFIMGENVSKDLSTLFARISCTCSAVKTLYMSCTFSTFSLYMSCTFSTFSCLNRVSVCDTYGLIFMNMSAFFCKRYNLLVVEEFTQAVIPYMRWLCTSVMDFNASCGSVFLTLFNMNMELAILDFN